MINHGLNAPDKMETIVIMKKWRSTIQKSNPYNRNEYSYQTVNKIFKCTTRHQVYIQADITEVTLSVMN